MGKKYSEPPSKYKEGTLPDEFMSDESKFNSVLKLLI